jgi:hypothetical protein
MTKPCKYCQTPFEPLNPKGQFCKSSCKMAWYRREQKGEGAKPVGKQSFSSQLKPPAKAAAKPSSQPAVRPSTNKPVSKHPHWSEVTKAAEPKARHSPGKPLAFTGPKLWEPMAMAELKVKLVGVKHYREWAKRTGLVHMVISVRDLENLIRQAGHPPETVDLSGFSDYTPKRDVPQSTESKANPEPDDLP